MKDILDSIEGALSDYALSPDAMRWSPEPEAVPADVASPFAVSGAPRSIPEYDQDEAPRHVGPGLMVVGPFLIDTGAPVLSIDHGSAAGGISSVQVDISLPMEQWTITYCLPIGARPAPVPFLAWWNDSSLLPPLEDGPRPGYRIASDALPPLIADRIEHIEVDLSRHVNESLGRDDLRVTYE